jgi:hypothetical protein
MKTQSGFVLILFAFLFSVPSVADATPGGRLLKAVAQNEFLLNEAMVSTLGSRCESYLFKTPGAGLWRQYRCRESAQIFKRALDQQTFRFTDADGKMSTQIAFRSKAMTLLSMPEVLDYLTTLNQRIELAFLTGQELNLFEFTALHTKSQDTAFEWLAVLFQDNSPTQSLIRWLEENPPATWSASPELTEAIAEELIAVTDFLTSWRLGFLELPFEFHLFPRHFMPESHDLRKPYHFYVPAYLSLRMVELGVEPELAQFQSYMFNYLYEIFHSESVLPKILREPSSLDAPEKALDIYAGYAGTIYALGPWRQRLTFENFRMGLLISPHDLNLYHLKTLYDRSLSHGAPIPLGITRTF